MPGHQAICLALALALSPAGLRAQNFGPPVPPEGESRLPTFPSRGEKPPGLKAPTTPPVPQAPAREGTTPRVYAREVQVTGSTVFSPEALAQVTAPYVGRMVTDEDLAALRQALTLKYVNAGYINSGAVLPDQQVADGIIQFRIIEGRLLEIEVSGLERLSADYVRDRLALGGGPPLEVGALQDRIQILLQRPFIKRINAELSPGDQPGEASLSARVEEGPAGGFSVTLDNDLSPSLGDARLVVSGHRFNLAGRGDILSGRIEQAQGYTTLAAGYGIPLNAQDTSLDVFAEWNDGRVVEKPLNELDIESDALTLGVRLNHPLRQTAREHLTVSAGFDRRQSQSKLLGTGFAFSPGVEPDGKSKVNVLRFILDYVSRDRDSVIAARSTISRGVDAFGSTNVGGGEPSGKFLALLGQLQYARRLGESGNQLMLRFDGQLSAQPLLPLEQFSVGGLRTVRGFRRNQLVRDRGFAASGELWVPLARNEDGAPVLQVAPFVDVGGAWYKGRASFPPQTLSSVGLGLRYSPSRNVHAELYWANAVAGKDVVNPTHTLQDQGWHLVIRTDL